MRTGGNDSTVGNEKGNEPWDPIPEHRPLAPSCRSRSDSAAINSGARTLARRPWPAGGRPRDGQIRPNPATGVPTPGDASARHPPTQGPKCGGGGQKNQEGRTVRSVSRMPHPLLLSGGARVTYLYQITGHDIKERGNLIRARGTSIKTPGSHIKARGIRNKAHGIYSFQRTWHTYLSTGLSDWGKWH